LINFNSNHSSNLFESISENFKNPNLLTELHSNYLNVLDNNLEVVGYLLPFSQLDLNDPLKISKLTIWRNENVNVYPTRFLATPESTSTWLQKLVIENPNRLLFWIIDLNQNLVGHLGVTKNKESDFEYELDNVIRGSVSTPGIMSLSIKRLEEWVESEFSTEYLHLKVMESNIHAIEFYKKLGYELVGRIGLKEETQEEITKLIPGSPEVDAFVLMAKNIIKSRPKLEKILTAGPTISTLEISFVNDAVRNGWNNHHSDYISKFDNDFANFVGSKFAMATSSCTGALHLSLLALGIKEGDEVIVPEVTWVATASAVRYVGATPVFAEIDPITWTISLQSIKDLITEKTKAIIPVHLYGYAANVVEISDFAKSKGIFVVEDAAPAIGTKIGNSFAGAIGDIGCYSFQGAKMLVTGEGGMLVTNDEVLYRKAKKIQDHGRKPGTFWIEELGYKYKMSNIQAALGLAQLYRADNQIFRKRRINSWYKDGLKDFTGITFQEELVGTESICWMSSIKLGNLVAISRDEVMNKLLEKGIDSRPVFPAISQYPFWNVKNSPKPIAKEIGDRGINLPSGVNLSKNSIDHVISSLREILS
jgi:perosamine synthetase